MPRKFIPDFTMSLPSRTAAADRIPLFQKITFALGSNTDNLATGVMTGMMWLPFFNIGLGLNAVVLGLILMVLRGWDAITDPIMGNISDNARTRWGRRRPFIFVGAILTACLFPFIWHFPPSVADGTSWLASAADWIPFIGHLDLDAPQKAISVYLTLAGLVFFSCFTIWSMPYYGLQLELTPDYDERTRLTAIMTLVGKIVSLGTAWLFVVIVFAGTLAHGDLSSLEGKPAWLRGFFEHIQPWVQSMAGEHLGEKPIVTGMRLMCWVIAAMILVFGLMPALFVKERYYAKEVARQTSDPFFQSLKETLRCGPLWALIFVSFFLVMGSTSVSGLGQYVNIYYVCGGDMLKAGIIGGIKGNILAISGICVLPLYTWLGARYDKSTVVIAMLATSIFGHLLNYWLMSPEYPYLQVVSAFFESSAITAIWMFVPSMKADVADHDELHTHRRREGAINAFYSWFIKASLTASLGLSGFVLNSTGFTPNLGHQPDHVTRQMLHAYLVIPVVLWGVAIAAIWFYPLSRRRCAEIRATLEARRGAI